MPRKPRIHFKNAYYHVVLSGSSERPLFLTDQDRQFWETLVSEGLVRFGYRIHAYCWQTAQASMVVQVGELPLAKCLQNLTFRYTRYFNSTHQTTGPLFKGRYKAVLIDAAEYLGDLTCYVHSLPLQEEPTAELPHYAWSSLPSYLGDSQVEWLTKVDVDDWMSTPHSGASLLTTDLDSSKLFLKRPADSAEIDLFNRGNFDGRILGNERFQQKVLKPSRKIVYPVTLVQLARYICRQEGMVESQLKLVSRNRQKSRVRQMIAWIAVDLQIATLSEVARRYNRDLTTMSRNQRNFVLRMQDDQQLFKTVRRYRKAISGLSTNN